MPALRTSDFTPGIPIELSFRTCEPRSAPSKYDKDEMSFMTSAGSIYLDAEAARDIYDQIREQGIVPNEKACIVKIKTSHGGHRWHVQRPQSLERQLEDSLAQRPNRTAPPSGYASAAAGGPIPATTQHSNGNSNGNPNATPPAAPQPQSNTASAKMMACFLAAIEAVGEAQAFANRKGLGITFTSDNITSAALSCYINDCRNGGRP